MYNLLQVSMLGSADISLFLQRHHCSIIFLRFKQVKTCKRETFSASADFDHKCLSVLLSFVCVVHRDEKTLIYSTEKIIK